MLNELRSDYFGWRLTSLRKGSCTPLMLVNWGAWSIQKSRSIRMEHQKMVLDAGAELAD